MTTAPPTSGKPNSIFTQPTHSFLPRDRVGILSHGHATSPPTSASSPRSILAQLNSPSRPPPSAPPQATHALHRRPPGSLPVPACPRHAICRARQGTIQVRYLPNSVPAASARLGLLGGRLGLLYLYISVLSCPRSLLCCRCHYIAAHVCHRRRYTGVIQRGGAVEASVSCLAPKPPPPIAQMVEHWHSEVVMIAQLFLLLGRCSCSSELSHSRPGPTGNTHRDSR